jgi:hypothetical protein
MTKPRIRFMFTFPYIMQNGGGGRIKLETIRHLKAAGYDIEIFDPLKTEIDFDVLLVYDNTYHSPEILSFIKDRNVKVIILPIFDRNKDIWKMKLLKITRLFPFLTIHTLREKIFASGSVLIAHNNSEVRDLSEIYGVKKEKIKMFHLPISDEIISMEKTVTKDWFVKKYGWEDFVFCPAATVTKRKNQISLIKALKGTNIKLVLNNTQSIQDGLKEEFDSLTLNDPNILCLQGLSQEELISTYKAAKVSVSVSQSETAGLVNLEAGYLGCNLVVSKLEALEEYLEDFAIYIDQNSLSSIREGVQQALVKEHDNKIKDFIKERYTWDKYISFLEDIILN